VILEHDLARFSATVRAIDVWFGFAWDSASTTIVNQALAQVLGFLENPESCAAALESAEAATVYLALWTLAYADADAAVPLAARFLADAQPARRFVATHLLREIGLPAARQALLPALEDPDLHVAAEAVAALSQAGAELATGDLFERLERALPHFPRHQVLAPIVWPWYQQAAEQGDLARLLGQSLGARPAARLIPYLPRLDSWSRAQAVEVLAARPDPEPQVRDALLALAGDPSGYVRERVFKVLARLQITPEETMRLEGLLTRKRAALRQAVLTLLLHQPDAAAGASAARLLAMAPPAQRLAGLELLRQLRAAGREDAGYRTYAAAYEAAHPQRSATEAELLDIILDRQGAVPTLDDALGLLDPARRTPVTPPRPLLPTQLAGLIQQPLVTSAATACIAALDDLVQEHRTVEITLERWTGHTEVTLLGNAGCLPAPCPDRPAAEDAQRLPLRQQWEAWWAERPAALRDADGHELLRALAPFHRGYSGSYGFSALHEPVGRAHQKATRLLFGDLDMQKLKYPRIVSGILEWLVYLHPQPGAPDLLLDALETSLALVPASALRQLADPANAPDSSAPDSGFPILPGESPLALVEQLVGEDGTDFQDLFATVLTGQSDQGRAWWRNQVWLGWLDLARWQRALCPGSWMGSDHVRLWRLLRWLDEQIPSVPRWRPTWAEIWAAFGAGGATEADLLDYLLGSRGKAGRDRSFHDLGRLTGRKLPPGEADPRLQALVARCRRRIVTLELRRGDLPTATSAPALALRYAGGVSALVRLLQALGAVPLVRGHIYHDLGKPAVFSHLIRSTFPSAADTPQVFAMAVAGAGIPQPRLIELALYAPQWAGYVEHALGWPALADAVWWIHAHTKDRHWAVDQEIRDTWTAQAAERTSLTAQQLSDGAVDVAWFHRVLAALGAERWAAISAAAKYAAGGLGHTRAQLFAAALEGRITPAELIGRIQAKRHGDSVRALGLLPLVIAAPEAEVQERYQIIGEFVRTSRKFGPGRQANEKLAATIGLENLARTAGYADPLRLTWAMEARSLADFAAGPQVVTAGACVVSLAIGDDGTPLLTIHKGGKRLKAIPAAARKDPDVIALRARQREIRRQGARMRAALEAAMCRGDSFQGRELQALCAHPVLAPLLARLVFSGPAGAGYPVAGGQALESHDGGQLPVAADDLLRIAHPHDLLAGGAWSLWQRECFARERIQPFKQIFRELYLLTPAETTDGTISRRYAGHQVQPRQATALLGARGWISDPEEGVRRTFHDAGLTVQLTFLYGFGTPAEVEGLTLDGVQFTRRGEWRPLPLAEVPPRIFSEVMRDLDLVVSVAHRGGIDPEATASTVEMRAGLVRESCALLGLGNVRVQGSHALVAGRLGGYSVHLGSAQVHRQPGGALCIVPVHSQHRGRLFLPFADDDPRTAEVLSKVLLLARDTEIKDPTILEQLLAA
ncbi:MAG TPA: DUF5724 domain-containing protein, partial [Chloroflexia bacterium]|nr:DUF5724 domain-containing protein [Chloroflexia bacterium]